MTVDDAVRQRIRRAVVRFAPRWMAADLDDLEQIAVMRILRGSPDWTAEDALLRRIAYSVVVDELRRRKRRPEVGFSPSLPDRIANSGELSPELRAHGSAVGEQLLLGLATLSTSRRLAVTLYLQDHTVPEVARVLGWSFKRASNCVYRGLGDLRAELARRGLSRRSSLEGGC